MGTIDRRPYTSATVLNQSLLDECQDNLTNKLEMICELQDIGSSNETLYLSDRAKYVDGRFYYPRVIFPTIDRTIGDWLSNQIEFSSCQLKINNADGFYNHLIMGGSEYNGFIGRRVLIKIGIGEDSSLYNQVFTGTITEVAGFSRDTSSFTITARQDFERINVSIPTTVFTESDWPDIEENFIGLGMPIIYGDWTTQLRIESPEVPCYPVNGNDPLVNKSLEDPNAGDTALRCVISSNPLLYVDTASVTLLRGDSYYIFDPSDISIVAGSSNQAIDIEQKNLMIDGSPWIYETNDEFFIKIKGQDLGSYNDNIVAQAKDILISYTELLLTDFDSSWDSYRDKATPFQSAIANFKSRVWIQENTSVLEYVTSMLEQVRLEPYVTRDNKWAINSLHFEDFLPSSLTDYTAKNWDIILDSFSPQTDDRNNFNRASAEYSFSPVISQNKYSTSVYRNDNAITQSGKEISKIIIFPNLYIKSDVIFQLIEILRLATSYFERISMTLTSRAFLLDLGDFITLDVSIGSVDFINLNDPVTGQIRKIGYDPNGLVIPIEVWSFQLVPFPGSEKIGVNGIVGGYNATITEEI